MKTKPKLRRRQKERTALTYRKLLEAAEKVFMRDGFQAAKLADIASVAGYTRGAFYENFESKEDLFIAVAERQLTGLAENLLHAVRSASGIARKSKAVLEAVQQCSAARRWALLLLEFDLFILRQPKLRRRIRPMQARLLGGFMAVFSELYAAANRQPPASLAVISVGFGAMVQGLTLQRMLNGKLISAAEITAVLNRYIETMLSEKGTWTAHVPVDTPGGGHPKVPPPCRNATGGPFATDAAREG